MMTLYPNKNNKVNPDYTPPASTVSKNTKNNGKAKQEHYIVHMNFTFGDLTKTQIDDIVDRLVDILDCEFTEDWMMISDREKKI